MARRVRDKDIETREARLKLKARPKPYWRTIGRGLHLGYRKGKTGAVWVVRRYLGDEKDSVESIAIADDKEDANGVEILDFFQAQDAARSLRAPAARHAGAYTVKDAVDAYVESLDGRPSAF